MNRFKNIRMDSKFSKYEALRDFKEAVLRDITPPEEKKLVEIGPTPAPGGRPKPRPRPTSIPGSGRQSHG